MALRLPQKVPAPCGCVREDLLPAYLIFHRKTHLRRPRRTVRSNPDLTCRFPRNAGHLWFFPPRTARAQTQAGNSHAVQVRKPQKVLPVQARSRPVFLQAVHFLFPGNDRDDPPRSWQTALLYARLLSFHSASPSHRPYTHKKSPVFSARRLIFSQYAWLQYPPVRSEAVSRIFF